MKQNPGSLEWVKKVWRVIWLSGCHWSWSLLVVGFYILMHSLHSIGHQNKCWQCTSGNHRYVETLYFIMLQLFLSLSFAGKHLVWEKGKIYEVQITLKNKNLHIWGLEVDAPWHLIKKYPVFLLLKMLKCSFRLQLPAWQPSYQLQLHHLPPDLKVSSCTCNVKVTWHMLQKCWHVPCDTCTLT